jgi:hypothetical protein
MSLCAGGPIGELDPGTERLSVWRTIKTGKTELAMKILVIEDEVKTAKFLKKGLSEAGYVVDVAADCLQGLHLAV